MRATILASSLLLALNSGVMAGQVYKWVDAQGVTHFGAQPPQGLPADTLSTAVAQFKTAPAERTAAEQSGESEQRDIDRKVKLQVAAQEADLQRYCTTLRTNLAQLQNNPRVRIAEENGARRLNEEERQQRIGETKQKITYRCS